MNLVFAGEAPVVAEILNLRRFRKARRRAETEAVADRNRAEFGRRKGERAGTTAAAQEAVRRLDGHLRDRPAPDDPEPDPTGE